MISAMQIRANAAGGKDPPTHLLVTAGPTVIPATPQPTVRTSSSYSVCLSATETLSSPASFIFTTSSAFPEG